MSVRLSEPAAVTSLANPRQALGSAYGSWKENEAPRVSYDLICCTGRLAGAGQDERRGGGSSIAINEVHASRGPAGGRGTGGRELGDRRGK